MSNSRTDDSSSPARPSNRSLPRAPSSMASTDERDYKSYVQLAALESSRARQQKILTALQNQIDRCDSRIEHHEEDQTDGGPRAGRAMAFSSMPDSGGGRESHIDRAGRAMARARQEKIREALTGQLEECRAEIARIDRKMSELYDELGLDEETERQRTQAEDESSDFTFEY